MKYVFDPEILHEVAHPHLEMPLEKNAAPLRLSRARQRATHGELTALNSRHRNTRAEFGPHWGSPPFVSATPEPASAHDFPTSLLAGLPSSQSQTRFTANHCPKESWGGG